MYAIFEDGSRQYRVSPGESVRVDYREVSVGMPIEFSNVLLVASGEDVHIGQPLIAGAKIVAEVTALPTKKSVIQHFRRRKNYRRLKGHRQPYVEVTIKEITQA